MADDWRLIMEGGVVGGGIALLLLFACAYVRHLLRDNMPTKVRMHRLATNDEEASQEPKAASRSRSKRPRAQNADSTRKARPRVHAKSKERT